MVESENKFHYGWVILVLCFLTVFCSLGLARFGYAMILPSMQKDLELTNTEAGGLATGNFIGYLCLALIGGFLSSHFSPRRVISLSLLVVGLMMVLTATSRGFMSALIWRAITGIGSGGSNVPAMGLLAAWFAAKRRGISTGIAVAGSSLGLILTGPLVPWLLDFFGESGWRNAWVALGGIVLVISIINWIFLKDRPQKIGLLPVGSEEDKNNDKLSGGEEETASDLKKASWRDVYGSKAVWHLALIYVTFGFSYIIYLTFFAKYIAVELGMGEAKAGTYWQIIGWLSVSCGIIWGWFSDIAGRKYGLAVVSLLQGSSYLIFAVWRTPTGLLLSVILFGITAWSIPAIMAAACGDQLGSRMAPAALGFITLFFGMGQALGPWMAGRIADMKGTFSPAFLLAMAVAWSGALAALFLRHTRTIDS
ncbi:YbfB/YjiJ family MFS transporter [Candidatus Sumerlaeota bacterium]|nr:YbfB/YjiJ family MFS transporter [Candidatus Sumerlaeota bacterium]